jgi:signal transduction histidine kinase
MSDTKARLQRLERILEISRELTSTVALEPLLRKIVITAAELTDSEGGSILLWNARTGELHFRTACGARSGRLLEDDIPVPIEGSIAGTVLTSGEPIIVHDAQADPRHYRGVGEQTGSETQSLLAVPLQIKDKRIGVLEAVDKQGDQRFSQEDVDTLMTLAAQAAVAIENARLVGALRKAYERLGELDRLKSDFIAIASHELRTPLSLILLYAALLREQLGTAAGAQLDAVFRSAMRLKHIIETMLNLRYLETGQVEVKPKRFDLREAIENACSDYEALAETNGLVLCTDLPDQQVSIEADEEKIRVILDNLISNAVKFTPQGGQVMVALGCRDDDVEISVADTGVGIPAEELERIFGRFYQVEEHMIRRHGGMGLGLAIVKGLVELHGGRVWAESAPGQGSRFIVVLPRSAAPGQAP